VGRCEGGNTGGAKWKKRRGKMRNNDVRERQVKDDARKRNGEGRCQREEGGECCRRESKKGAGNDETVFEFFIDGGYGHV
jgi:hypothetical protein